jgi:peptide/nickel transport system permease protein
MALSLLRRLGLYLLTLFLASLLVFVATEVLPGDALEVSLTSEELSLMTHEDLDRRRAELGLDRPAALRYLNWLGNAARGDFGVTIIGKTPVIEIIRDPVKNSLLLALVTALVAIPCAVLLGVLAAYYRGRLPDRLASMVSIVGYSVPEFAFGNFLILVFAIWIPLFPAVIMAFANDTAGVLLAVSVLPVATIVFGSIAHLVRLIRSGLIEALASDFVERARFTGLGELRLVLRHALPAAVIPALNSAALYVAGLLSGIVVVEKVFAYPGLGMILLQAVDKREVAVVQAISLLAALLVVTMNLLADLAVVALDPRTRRT